MVSVKGFSKVGQTSRSRSQGKKLWYHVQGLVIKNTNVKYKHPTLYQFMVLQLWPMLMFFKSRLNFKVTRSQGQKLWYHLKSLVIRNTHIDYESPTSYGI